MRFPNGFAWGVATASYQIEGAVDADGRRRSIWDTFSHTPGRIVAGHTGDIANDHYHRYESDVALMAELGVTHYRFSLAWPRIQPAGSGSLNPAGLDFYARLTDTLLSHGIQPWVTLYHWDLPQPLQDSGGWPQRDTAKRFAEYAAATYARLGDRIPTWTTLNEPWCSAFLGYAAGTHAPGVQDPAAAVRAVHHLLLGHGMAVEQMRALAAEVGNHPSIGITLNLYPVASATDAEQDRDAARRIDGQANRIFLDPLFYGHYPNDILTDLEPLAGSDHIHDGDLASISAPLDVLGVNYYSPHVVRAGSTPTNEPSAWVNCGDVEFVPQGLPTSDMGWEIEPDGLYRVLSRVHHDYPAIPLYVTENGIALPDQPDTAGVINDQARIDYLRDHLRAADRAMSEGVDLRGYFVWTFTDNFEWAWGYTKRFGLVYVDVDSQERVPKQSARWFAEVARARGLQ